MCQYIHEKEEKSIKIIGYEDIYETMKSRNSELKIRVSVVRFRPRAPFISTT